MSTQYLKFPDQQTAEAALVAAGFTLTEWRDHVNEFTSWIGVIPDTDGYHANIYDCEAVHDDLQQYVVAAPATPYNKRA
jgi:hypothetical protein